MDEESDSSFIACWEAAAFKRAPCRRIRLIVFCGVIISVVLHSLLILGSSFEVPSVDRRSEFELRVFVTAPERIRIHSALFFEVSFSFPWRHSVCFELCRRGRERERRVQDENAGIRFLRLGDGEGAGSSVAAFRDFREWIGNLSAPGLNLVSTSSVDSMDATWILQEDV